MLDDLLSELQQTWDFSSEELLDIKEKILNYGMACIMDSSIQEEAIAAAKEQN